MSIKPTRTFARNLAKGFTLSLLSLALVFGFSTYLNQSSKPTSKSAAAGINNANLIIGRVETATTVEISSCLENTGDSIRLTNSSLWLNFDNSQLTPNPVVTQQGIFNPPSAGYITAGFSQIAPAPVAPSTSETWGFRTNFSGTVTPPTVEPAGVVVPNTPALVGKVTFNKVGTQTNPAISITRSRYLTVEYGITPITLIIVNQSTACNVPAPCTNGANNPPSCNICPAGQYLNTTTNSCTQCPAGSACTGGISPQGQPIQPTPCVAGTYAAAGATTCTTCPVNTYCPGTGNNAPTNCPAGQTSLAGSISQAACTTPACTNGANNPPSCNICPAGQYLNTTTNSCTQCPAGSACTGGISPQGQPIQPTPCVAGTYAAAGATTCTTCPAGTTSIVEATSIASCTDNVAPNTTITSNPTSSTTVTTASFTFTSTETNASYECKIDNESFALCTSPKLYTNLALGSHTFQVRSIDIAGNVDATPESYTWRVTAAALPVCANGASNPSTCTSCPAGQYYVSSTKTCGSCPSGTYSATSTTACTTCPVNTYCPGPNTTTPAQCPTGKTSKEGAKTVDECVNQTATTVTPRTGGMDVRIVVMLSTALIGGIYGVYRLRDKNNQK